MFALLDYNNNIIINTKIDYTYIPITIYIDHLHLRIKTPTPIWCEIAYTNRRST